MLLVRALPRFLLALALVVGGMAGAGVSAMAPGSEASTISDSPLCHEAAPGEEVADESSAGMGCCDQDACGCDCLHSPPPLVLSDGGLATRVPAGLGGGGSLPAPPGTLASPDIRPPIA